MGKLADEDGPVLRRVRVPVDLVGDHLAEARLLGEPLAREAADGVPPDLDGARRAVEQRLRHGDGVGLVAEPDGMLEGELAFVEVLLAGGRLSVRRARRGGAASVQKVVDLVPLPLAGLGILVGLGHVARLLPVASAVVSCREQSWLMLARLSGSDWQSPFHVRRSPPARGAPDGGSLPGRPGCATVLLGRQSRAVRNGMNPRGRTHLRRRRDALPGSSRLNGSRDMYLYLM